ncbi:MAG: SPFH domain-containing protein, partial [Oscillospiraceae bacterium]|nr:SPFH domain-containing protein [Oscillospiraceae bacterium]
AAAMQAAAANEGAGPAMAFMGMGMAQNMGGVNAANLYQMGQQQPQMGVPNPQAVEAAKDPRNAMPVPEGWTCSCGAVNTGKFCTNCGAGKPADGWVCACGAVNKGKFCPNCGAKKPAGVPQYKCDKCGWEPEDPKNPPKFCPNCGDLFGDEDIK